MTEWAEGGFGGAPPQDLAAEQAVLGAMLMSKNAITDVLELIRGGDFYKPAHELVFGSIVRLYGAGQPADPITVAAELTARGEIGRAGGAVYLHDLLSSVGIAANGSHYAGIVREKAVLRRLLEASVSVAQMALSGSGGAARIADEAAARVMAAGEVRRSSSATLAEMLPGVWKGLDDAGGAGITTGIGGLDGLLGGLRGGRMVVVGARPAVGKSLLAGWMVLSAARAGAECLVFSAEMTKAELAVRWLAAESGVASDRIGRRELEGPDWDRLLEASNRLAGLPVTADDVPGTVLDVVLESRRWRQRRRGAPGLVVIDYLQLLESPSRAESRQVEVAGMSRRLKALAGDLDVPVVALSQLNRSSDLRSDRRPALSDLRESGALEQDADQVVLLHEPPEPQRAGELDLIVAKNRHGATGVVPVVFQKHLGRFTEPAA